MQGQCRRRCPVPEQHRSDGVIPPQASCDLRNQKPAANLQGAAGRALPRCARLWHGAGLHGDWRAAVQQESDAAHIVSTCDHADHSWMLDKLGVTLWDVRNGMLWAGWFTALVACLSEPFT